MARIYRHIPRAPDQHIGNVDPGSGRVYSEQFGPDRYLVTLSVTTAANQAVAAAPATDAIVNGFRVAAPAAPVAPAAAPAPAPSPAPAAAATPTPIPVN